MLLAVSFIFDWINVLLSFFAVIIVLMMVPIVAGWSVDPVGLRLTPTRKRILVVVSIAVFAVSQVGFAAAGGSQRDDRVKAARFHHQAAADLKTEGFQPVIIDDFTKTAILPIGKSGCTLPLPLAQTTSRHDPVIKWRPTLSTAKRQFGLEPVDLKSLAAACS